MNLNFCPNKKSKEFLEMVAALGGEDKAYFFWMRNKGNHLEKAPNGANSKLFNDLLEHFEGNRAEALRAKARVYTNEFFNWFGDWTSNTNDFNLDNIDYSLVDIEEYTKPWKDDPEKSNRAIRIYLKDRHEKGFFELVKDHEDGYFSVHFKTAKEGAKYNSPTAEPSSKEDRKILFQQLVNAIPNGAKISTWGSLSEDGVRGLDNVGRNMHKVGERSVRLKSDDSEIKIPIYQKGQDVSKVVDENGEPLVVWHGGSMTRKFDTTGRHVSAGIKKGDVGSYFTTSKRSAENYENIHDYRYGDALFYILDEMKENGATEEEIEKEWNTSLLGLRSGTRPFYLSIKNAKNTHYSGTKESGYNREDSNVGENDGQIITIEDKAEIEYVVFNPNQIKHIENLGTFNPNDPDIYHHIDKRVSGTGNLLDEIPKEGATIQQIVNNVVDFLKNKFVGLDIEVYDDVFNIPQQNDDDKRVIGILSSNKNIKSMVYHGKVYIIQSRLLKQGGQIASEEILHMLVKTLQQDNQALFQKLLKEAKSTFKKLTKEIESAYKSLGQDTINNEIVTQALARFVNRDIQQHRHSKFADLVELFVEWLKSVVRNAAEKLGNTIYIDPTLLKNLTLQELSDLINAEDTRFDINTSSNSTFYNLSDNSSMNSILESNDQEELLKKATGDNAHLKVTAINTAINNTREAFVQRQVEKYLITNEDASAADIYGIRIGSSVDWDEGAVKRIISELQEKMAKVFGLEKRELPDGSFVYTSSDKSKDSKLRVCFVNSITGQDWTDEDGIVHKGMFEEGTKGEEAAWNAIYLSLEAGDATTFTHEMAHYYVRTFWESEPIQEALKEVDKTLGRKENEEAQLYSKRLEEKLVTWLTDQTMKDSEKKISFWNKINKILHGIGEWLNRDSNARNNILDSLHAAFVINQDLADRVAEIIYFEKYIGPVHEDEIKSLTEEEVNEIDGTTFYKIKATLESREKSERSRGKTDNYDLLNIRKHLQKIQKRSITSKDDVASTVSDFLLLAAEDVERAVGVLSDIILKGEEGIANLDIDDFMHLKTDVVGYYDTMLSNVIDEYIRNSKTISDDLRDKLLEQKNNIRPNIDILKNSFDRILNRYVDYKIELYAEELVTIGDKDLFVANMKLWARNQIGGGKLAFLENALGPAVISRSPIVRLVEYLVTAQNRISYESALKVGHELIDRYKKCASIGKKLMSINFMKQFCELDDDGNPTGYFARKWNYGKLYKKRDAIIEKLIKKYDLSYDEDTNEILFKDRDEYVKYMTDFYNEMDKIANFRYKKEYYIERAKILSPKAIKKQNTIQRQIDTLLAKAVDKELGVPVISNLSSVELNELDKLRIEKQNLANPYIITYNADGSINHIEEKQGEDLEIALQFIKWNAYKSGKVKYKSNFEKFNQVRDKIVEKYGENSRQVRLFDSRYKTRKIRPEFYDRLGEQYLTDELRELYARRSAIVNSIMHKTGYYQPNLKKLNDEAFAELKRIDIAISLAYSRIPDDKKTTQSDQYFSKWATKPFVGEYDDAGNLTTNLAYNYFIEKERASRSARGLSPFDESAYVFTNAKGYTNVLSVFKYTKPNLEEDVQDVLLGEYSELDLNSELVNTDFDASLLEELQPKQTEEFRNKNWEIIQNDKNLKQFYDALLLVMEEAYQMLPNFEASKMKYVLPQMRDRDAKLIFRNRYLLTNMGASVADAFTITETDTKYNESFSQRADGSLVETIPIRWVSKMKEPSIICTDLVKSVTLFYEMAQNYRNKAEVNPMLQALLFLTQGGYSAQTVTNGKTEQAQRIEKFLLMYVYGRTRTGFDSSKPMDRRAKAVSLITDTILSKAHAKLMNHNWRAILKNFVDSFLTDMGEIVSGKYITVKDALWANGEMAREIFGLIRSFGRANNKSKISALMQLNGVSGSIGEVFGQHNETWLRRIISKHFAMGEYTLVDYTFKGHLTAALYHSIRLVKNPITKELEFMTKDQAMFHYHDAGLNMEDGVNAWKRAKITLFDAYDVDDKGNAFVIEKYKKYVFPVVKSTGNPSRRLVNQVHGIIRERSSVINGILDQSGKAAWQQNVAGALILLMRGWMITQMWDNLKDGHDFAEYESQWRRIIDSAEDKITTSGPGVSVKNPNINGLERKIVNEDPEYRGQYNFETGTIEHGQWRGLGSAFRHGMKDVIDRTAAFFKHARALENSGRLTRNERYKLRRLSTMAATFIIVCGLTYITTALRLKWPDEWYLHLLNAVNVSVISERASQIPVFAPLSILDIVNSIVISKTLINDADKFVDLLLDLIEVCDQTFSGGSTDYNYDDPIKSGAYRDLERWERDAIKVESYLFPDFSVDNVFRSMTKTGNDASINYYIQNVSPTKQAVGIANILVPWATSPLGLDLDVPDKKKQKKKNSNQSLPF